MHGRVGSRGHRPSYSGSVGQKAQLTNAYSELGNALLSTQIKTVGNYTLGRVIGEGSFGKVRLAVNKLTSQRCAIKQIPRSVAPPLLTREIHHHRRLHHPNVLRLFEVIATENSIWLITELCAGGELFDYLVEKGRLSELEAKRMFGQLCLGVGHIHNQGVVHRDLKLENVLLDERCNVKIADFGFGREFEQRRLMETYCGTTGYAAPEMLAGRKYTGQGVDVWSLGVILYTLLTGSLPFDDDDEEVMKQKILAGDYDLPLWLSEDSRDLISNILQQEPLQRLSIAQILGHNWFTRPYTMSPQPADYFQTFDTLPLTIPEESGSPPADTPEATINGSTSAGIHLPEPSTANSEASTSSYHSAASASESDYGMSNSRSGTPLTADEHQDSGDSSPHSNGKGKGVDRSGPSTIHRNTSQSTITQSESLLSLSRYSGTPMAVHQESPAIGYRFPLPSPLPGDGVPYGSPALPMQAHSRTPSRTKRRSIGSTMSERLLPKDEGPALPDYLALLSAPYPAAFSTPLESHLLESLSLLGFDTGQMIHSVRTDACDASGAIWWMLKLKAEQKELDAQEAASSLPQKSDSMNSLAHSVGRISLASQGRRTPLIGADTSTDDVQKAGDRVSEELPARPPTSQPESIAEEAPVRVEYGGPEHAPSPRKPRLSVGAAGKMSSVSAPALSPNKASSDRPPSPPPQMPNFNKNPSDPAASTLAKSAIASTDTSRSTTPQTKPRSASVSTVSMLQRAGSVLGVSVGKKDKVDDSSATEARLGTGDAGRSTPSLLGTALFGRKASGSQSADARPTLEQKHSKELLGAKSGASDKSSNRNGSPDLSSSTNSEGRASVKPTTPVASPARQPVTLPVSTPKAESSASRSDVSLASGSGKSIAGQSPNQPNPLRSSVASNKSAARSSKNLFSSFRHWFNDDRRKSKRYRQSSVPVLAEPPDSPSARTGTLRKATVHAPSPLKRPPIARMPSNGPPSAAMSRRNSSTSARRVMPGDPASPLLGHSRRRSDASRNSLSSINGARTPTSEKGDRGREVESRPPSSQSHQPPTTADMYNAARKRHGRASSTSSTASRSSVMISGSPVAAYRRTPAVTQVKRLSTPKHDKHRLSQSHQTSAPSSVHESDSRRSSMSVHAEAEDTIIEEESVTPDEVQAERSRALRKLSGDAGQLLEAVSSQLEQTVPSEQTVPPAESGIAQSRPMSERRPSSESFNNRNTARPSHSSHARSSSAHATAVFAAHRVVNPFGTPNGTHFQHHARRSSEGQRPKLRDVFKNKKPDGEGDWLDEDEELESYSGGFGQGTGRQPASTGSASQSSRTVGLGVSNSGRDTLAPGPSTPTPIFGEGRYAGLGVRSDDSAPSTGSPAWKGSQGARGPSFRTAATVVEEEEEEEE